MPLHSTLLLILGIKLSEECTGINWSFKTRGFCLIFDANWRFWQMTQFFIFCLLLFWLQMRKFWNATFESCVTYAKFAVIKQKIIDYDYLMTPQDLYLLPWNIFFPWWTSSHFGKRRCVWTQYIQSRELSQLLILLNAR